MRYLFIYLVNSLINIKVYLIGMKYILDHKVLVGAEWTLLVKLKFSNSLENYACGNHTMGDVWTSVTDVTEKMKLHVLVKCLHKMLLVIRPHHNAKCKLEVHKKKK